MKKKRIKIKTEVRKAKTGDREEPQEARLTDIYRKIKLLIGAFAARIAEKELNYRGLSRYRSQHSEGMYYKRVERTDWTVLFRCIINL